MRKKDEDCEIGTRVKIKDKIRIGSVRARQRLIPIRSDIEVEKENEMERNVD